MIAVRRTASQGRRVDLGAAAMVAPALKSIDIADEAWDLRRSDRIKSLSRIAAEGGAGEAGAG